MSKNESVDAASMHPIVHTPGPWRQGGVKELSPSGRCREIVADDGRIGLVYGTTDADCKANAQLIASAPELLEACRLVFLWMIGGQPGPHSDSIVLEQVRAAIHKASL
jgi:hypothetical protein